VRVAVVGGGPVGLCVALELTRAGAEVVVLDRGEPDGGAAMANAGWVVPALSAPLSGPGVLTATARATLRGDGSLLVRGLPSPALLRWCAGFVRQCARPRHRAGVRALLGLGSLAVERFHRLHESGVEFEWHQAGLLLAARTDHGLREAEEIAETAREAGYTGRFEVHRGAAVRTLEPALGPEVLGGVHLRDEAHVRPETFVAGLRAWLAGHGAEVRDGCAVLGVEPAGRGWRVATGTGQVDADRVVLAAGAWTPALLAHLGVPAPVQPGKGYSLTAAGSGPAPAHPLKLVEANIACTPFDGGLRVSGMFELGARDGAVRTGPVRHVLRRARRYLPGWTPGSRAVRLAGMRPATPDSLPIVGAVPGRDGLFVATGHGTLGLTLAPATGSLLAPLVLHGRAAPELAPFTVDRFAA
jgi:D-amino-acid dehydrogenase